MGRQVQVLFLHHSLSFVLLQDMCLERFALRHMPDVENDEKVALKSKIVRRQLRIASRVG